MCANPQLGEEGLGKRVKRSRALVVLFLLPMSLRSSPAATTVAIDVGDRAFLEDLQRRSVLYFWEQADPKTGLVLDRAGIDGGRAKGPSRDVASTAATGFGLTAMCIGAEHGWVSRQQALERVRNTLRFFADRAFQEHGWFYHWMDAATGERKWKSEVSSIDTAFLVAGIFTAAQCFPNEEDVATLAKAIFERIDFEWMLSGDRLLLSHGWSQEHGFIKYRWDTYSEASLLYLLAIGSPTHPIPAESWYGWSRPLYDYGAYHFISGGPLFTHQYSHAWVDFRNRRDRGFIDFFQNSVNATQANHLFCLNLQTILPGSYGPDLWGATASDSMKGYKIYGEIDHFEPVDGTIAPYGPGGSLMFTPEMSTAALKLMRQRFEDRVYGRYGFVDAFNITADWFDTDVVGIDVGITLLSAENLLTGNVWQWFMANREVVPRAMDLVGFSVPPGAKISPESKPTQAKKHSSKRNPTRSSPRIPSRATP
jgi:hypothetical protein